MKQTSSFGSTKGLCQIARLTSLTPFIPTLKIPQLHNCSQFAFQPELWGLWPCCYGHIPKAPFGSFVSTLLSSPALLTGVTRRDLDCALTQSWPITLARALATASQEALLSPDPNLQGFVLSLPKSHKSLNSLSLSSKLLSLRFYFTLLTS